MIQRVNPEDFDMFQVEDLTVYIQKSFVDSQNEIVFLIPYFGKEKIKLTAKTPGRRGEEELPQ